MSKPEPTPQGTFNHLYTGREHTVMSNKAGLHVFLMGNGGTIIVMGNLRKVVTKHLGAGAYEVYTEEIPCD